MVTMGGEGIPMRGIGQAERNTERRNDFLSPETTVVVWVVAVTCGRPSSSSKTEQPLHKKNNTIKLR